MGQVDYLIKLLQAKKGLGFRAFKTKRLFRGVEGPLSKTLNPKRALLQAEVREPGRDRIRLSGLDPMKMSLAFLVLT